MPPVGRKEPSVSSVEAVTGRIRDLIAERNLRAGDPLPPERELSEVFAVSRNTVRESLRTLEAYGVILRKRRGAIVTAAAIDVLLRAATFQMPCDRETFSDVQAFRSVLEIGLAPAILSRITPAAIGQLRQINAGILEELSVAEIAERDFLFHVRLIEASGSRTAATVFAALQAQLLGVMRCGKDAEGRLLTFRTHNAILDALDLRSLVDLRGAFERHYEASLRCMAEDRDLADATLRSAKKSKEEMHA